MEHSKIGIIAAGAAHMASHAGSGDITLEEMSAEGLEGSLRIYAYCRERKFPLAEQLARKAAELGGQAFPAGQWQANEAMRASFEVFRAVAQALEPFWEEDHPEGEAPPETEASGADAGEKNPGPAGPEKTETETMTPTPKPDSVAARTEAGQKAMDDAIAEATGEPQAAAADKDSGEPATGKAGAKKTASKGATGSK